VANTQSQFGFKHNGFLPGYAPDYQLMRVSISSTNNTQIGFGDPVTQVAGTSFIIQSSSGSSSSTTGPILGIFQGCEYIPTAGGAPQWSPFWPGTSGANGTGYVIAAPGATFLVAALQTAVGSTLIGNAIGFTTGAPVTTGGGFSIATVDQSTATSTGTTASTLPFKVVDLYSNVGVGNGADTTTNYNWVIVTFNSQQFRSLGSL
jgi:hypothetical protein